MYVLPHYSPSVAILETSVRLSEATRWPEILMSLPEFLVFAVLFWEGMSAIPRGT